MNIIDFATSHHLPCAGDGHTDCLPAFQAAVKQITDGVTANPANPAQVDSVIDIPGGLYRLSGPLRIGCAVHLRGVGITTSGYQGSVLIADYNEHDPLAGFLDFTPTVPYLGTGTMISGLNVFKGHTRHGGVGVKAVVLDPNYRPGFFRVRDSMVNAYADGPGASWDRCLYLDGTAVAAVNGMGLRDTILRDSWFAGADVATLDLRGCAHLFWQGGSVYQASGKVSRVLVGGGPGLQQSQGIQFDGVEVYGSLEYDQATQFRFAGLALTCSYTQYSSYGLIDAIGLTTPVTGPKVTTVRVRS